MNGALLAVAGALSLWLGLRVLIRRYHARRRTPYPRLKRGEILGWGGGIRRIF